MPIKFAIKNGRRIVKGSERINLGGDTITAQTVIDAVEEMSVFFEGRTIQLTLQLSYKGRLNAGKIAGIAYCWKNQAFVWSYGLFKGYNYILAIMAHELGHIHQYRYAQDDYNACTDYGAELYADEFAKMVLGRLWLDSYASIGRLYKGYPNQYKIQDYQTGDKILGL